MVTGTTSWKQLFGEPTVILYALVIALNAAQVVVISMPDWLHAAIIGVTAGLTALVNRSLVTPTSKVVAPSASPTVVPPPSPTQ